MRYNKQSIKYVSKNFIFLLPFAILPAVLFSLSTDEEAIIRVIKAIFHWNLSSWTFFDLFRAISVLKLRVLALVSLRDFRYPIDGALCGNDDGLVGKAFPHRQTDV